MDTLAIAHIDNSSDIRGDSFHFPRAVFDYLGAIKELHYATVDPGAVRGNHYHIDRKEMLFVYFSSAWKLAWRTLASDTIETRDFSGQGAVIIHIDANVVHAIKNTGKQTLHLVSCSNARAEASDTDWQNILNPDIS